MPIAYMVTDTMIPEKTVCRWTGVVVVVLVHVGYCLFLLFIIIIIIIIIIVCYAIRRRLLRTICN